MIEMSDEQKQILSVIQKWLTPILLGVVAFFLVRTMDSMQETAKTSSAILIRLERMDAKMTNQTDRIIRLENRIDRLEEWRLSKKNN